MSDHSRLTCTLKAITDRPLVALALPRLALGLTLSSALTLLATSLPAAAQTTSRPPAAGPASSAAAKSVPTQSAAPGATQLSDAELGARVASVNGRDIPRRRLELLMSSRPPNGEPDTPDLREKARQELINRELVVQEAERIGLTKGADFKEQVEMARQQVILGLYLRDFVARSAVTEEQIKSEYDSLSKRNSAKEFKVAHILVKTESEAKDLIAKIKKGANFADIAKIASEYTGSKGDGGDLGWKAPGNFVEQFSEAMIKLGRGEMTQEPVRTQYGYHIIRVDDTRALKIPPLEEIHQDIARRLQQLRVDKMISDLRYKAKID